MQKNEDINLAFRSNSLVEARYSLSVKQNNILDMLLMEIEDDDEYSYVLTVDKYITLFKADTSNIYRDFKNAVKSFENKGFRIKEKNSDTETYFAWFSKIKYMPNKGQIEVNIDRDLKKILYEEGKKTIYDLKYSLNFTSSYSQRVYYYLKRFEDTGMRIDKIEDLLIKLECPKSYAKITDFKRYVLEKAKEDINKISDILFDYQLIKTGNKTTHVKFTIHKKEDLLKEIAIDADENITIDDIRKVISIDLTEIELNIILSSAIESEKRINKKQSIISYVEEKDRVVVEYLKNKKNGNYAGAIIKAIQNDWQSNNLKPINKGNFNNFEQRQYTKEDLADLERKLLGWD